jgi:hypothetical protein
MPVTPIERCPWCGSTITHSKFLQVQAAIREDERKKLAEQERSIRAQLTKEIALQQQKFAKERKALDDEKAKLAKQMKKEVADVRAILQKDRENAILKKEAEFARERAAMQKKIADLSKRAAKAGGELGEGGEIDLFEELRAAFPEDELSRTKGKTSGNIVHDVRYKGKSAGRILIDSRPRGAWQHGFVVKLREDQSTSGADHAVLATTVFPAGRRELFIDSGVIVVAPARVRPMIEVLRKALISMHVAKLSDAERADKLGRLFKFMTSPAFKRKLAEASDLAGEALQIDVDEKRTHDNVWKKRGTVLTRIKNVLREIDTDVSAIVEARDDTQDEALAPPTPLRAAAYRITSK